MLLRFRHFNARNPELFPPPIDPPHTACKCVEIDARSRDKRVEVDTTILVELLTPRPHEAAIGTLEPTDAEAIPVDL